MSVQSFRDLRVWQMGMTLVEEIYKVTRGFPRHEQFGLTSQMQRAAVSIPSNIAEGHSREHLKEYLHHLSFAQSSLAELETQIEIALRLNYVTSEQSRDLNQICDSLGKQIRSLRQALSRKNTAPTIPTPRT